METLKRIFKRKIYVFLFSNIPIILLFVIVVSVAAAADNVRTAALAKDSSSQGEIITKEDLGIQIANFEGFDNRDTEFSNRVLSSVYSSENHDPWNNGMAGWCEFWCYKVYRKAGLSYNGADTALNHAKKSANLTGKVPKGALIYSGFKSDGSFYESGTRGDNGENCGHIAIYVGLKNGVPTIAGSHYPFEMSFVQFYHIYGYGGWSLS